MRAGSSASSGTASRGECPFCFVPLSRIRSKQEDTKDQWFLKCPYNVKGDPTTCGFIHSEVEYEAAKAHGRRVQMRDVGCLSLVSGEAYAGLKEELDEIHQIVDSLVCDVLALKVQLGEPKVALVEPKQELETKKLHIVIDSAPLVPLLVGFVGVVLGVIVAIMWK